MLKVRENELSCRHGRAAAAVLVGTRTHHVVAQKINQFVIILYRKRRRLASERKLKLTSPAVESDRYGGVCSYLLAVMHLLLSNKVVVNLCMCVCVCVCVRVCVCV